MYVNPKTSILFTDRFAAINTESISINTPIAQGLIESIAAVMNTTPIVGK